MRYAIRHTTRFAYAQPAAFARCNLRLRPIDWPGQRLDSYALSVEPGGVTSPARAAAGIAHVLRLVVTAQTRTLTITSHAEVAVDRPVPIAAPDDPTLAEIAALARADRDIGAAGPADYLYPSPQIPLDRAIADWCAADLDPARGSLEAGIALARRIQAEF